MKTKLGIFSLTILTAATIAGTAQAHSGPGLMEGHLHLFWGIDQLGFLQKHSGEIQTFEEERPWKP